RIRAIVSTPFIPRPPIRNQDGQSHRNRLKGVKVERRSPASRGQTCTPKHRDDQWSRISPHIVGDERTRGSSVEFDIWFIRPKAARSFNLVDRFVAHALAELQDFAGGRVLTA
ncbi:MAG: hypothetical protein J0I61_09995, partial [Bosea sp.]|nr:hypothetical protein [Bosea sp. (in: a-proteobacteria)]